MKLSDCANQKYNSQDPRHIKCVNAIAQMICNDAAPTNIVGRKGFKHVMQTMDPRFNVPSPTTFSRTILPKMKEVVSSFHLKKIAKMLEKEKSMAFSIDGLDSHDVGKSSMYSFSVYFYDKCELLSEVIAVKALESPVDAETIQTFLLQCLSEIGAIEDGKPKLDIYSVSDEGSNLVRAFKNLKDDGVIAGFLSCFNHNLQNVIKDAVKATAGMENSLELFRKNAATLSRSKNERSKLRNFCKENNLPEIIPRVPGATRWFADLFMLEDFIRIERAMKLLLLDSEKVISIFRRTFSLISDCLMYLAGAPKKRSTRNIFSRKVFFFSLK